MKYEEADDKPKPNTESATPTNMSPEDFKEFFQTKLRG